MRCIQRHSTKATSVRYLILNEELLSTIAVNRNTLSGIHLGNKCIQKNFLRELKRWNEKKNWRVRKEENSSGAYFMVESVSWLIRHLWLISFSRLYLWPSFLFIAHFTVLLLNLLRSAFCQVQYFLCTSSGSVLCQSPPWWSNLFSTRYYCFCLSQTNQKNSYFFMN